MNEVKRVGIKPIFQKLYRDYTFIFSFVLLVIIFTCVSPQFLTYTGISTLIMQSTIKGILALGMTAVVICGLIDLSVGANLAFTGGVAILLLNATWNPWLMLLFYIMCSVTLNVVSALFITKGKMAPFIVTLAIMSIERSVIVQLGQGGPFVIESGVLMQFRRIASGNILGMPNLMLIFILLAVLMWVVMSKTKFGRYIYATGSSETAASLTGINTDLIKIQAFALHGVLEQHPKITAQLEVCGKIEVGDE